MARSLTSAMAAELVATIVRPLFLFQCTFGTTTLRLWSGYGDLSHGGYTWLGNGWLTGFSDIQGGNSVSSTGLDVSLSGVPPSLVSLILGSASHASRGSLWLGLFTSAYAIIADPYLLFEGALSAPRIDDSPDESEITLTFEDDLVFLQRSSSLRYTHDCQQSLFPGDLGFNYVAALDNWTGFWGTTKKTTTSKKKATKRKDKSSRK